MFPRSSAIFVLDIPQGLQDLSWVWVQDGQQGAAGDVRNPWEWGVPREFQEDISLWGAVFFSQCLVTFSHLWGAVCSDMKREKQSTLNLF